MRHIVLTLFLILLPCSALAGEMQNLVHQTVIEFSDEWERRHIKTTLEHRLSPAQLRELSRQSAAEATAATSQLRIVKCTEGAAVQERVDSHMDCDYRILYCQRVEEGWRTLPAGCIPLAAAELLYEDELAWRNRPPAPTVLEPVEVIEP